MKKNIYRVLVTIIFSMLIVSCGGSGGGSGTANTGTANTDCVLDTSNIGNCTL